ncbi:MAG: hypothetical protein JO033_08415 [Acidobacteriaceae bacterium]|nr:hypothetical protein [Acidobacteriaceae bacterium]MBV9498875.1 hypothetical protein [Acidobacteriaceae bacterium]
MSAATVAPAPLVREGNGFWQEFVARCKGHVESINAAASRHGYSQEELIEWRCDDHVQMMKSGFPSTAIKATIKFFGWGPLISGLVTGEQDPNLKFSAEEFELPIACDLDGEVVGVFDEGRSFSPQDLACYLTQNFRRCYPGVSLPC